MSPRIPARIPEAPLPSCPRADDRRSSARFCCQWKRSPREHSTSKKQRHPIGMPLLISSARIIQSASAGSARRAARRHRHRGLRRRHPIRPGSRRHHRLPHHLRHLHHLVEETILAARFLAPQGTSGSRSAVSFPEAAASILAASPGRCRVRRRIPSGDAPSRNARGNQNAHQPCRRRCSPCPEAPARFRWIAA